MSRIQLALNVDDLDAAIDFYGKLFARAWPRCGLATPTSPSPNRP